MFITLNTDGSMANFHMGAGGCLRDETGTWLVGFSKFVGLGNSLQSELWTIWLGLDHATHKYPNSKLQIETDSTQLTELLLQNTSRTHLLDSLIENCKLLLSRLANFRIIKASKQQNRYTDSLAKEGRINRLSLTIYNDAPDYVLLIYN